MPVSPARKLHGAHYFLIKLPSIYLAIKLENSRWKLKALIKLIIVVVRRGVTIIVITVTVLLVLLA